jgi:hypothetical protein
MIGVCGQTRLLARHRTPKRSVGLQSNTAVGGVVAEELEIHQTRKARRALFGSQNLPGPWKVDIDVHPQLAQRDGERLHTLAQTHGRRNRLTIAQIKDLEVGAATQSREAPRKKAIGRDSNAAQRGAEDHTVQKVVRSRQKHRAINLRQRTEEARLELRCVVSSIIRAGQAAQSCQRAKAGDMRLGERDCPRDMDIRERQRQQTPPFRTCTLRMTP